MRDKWGEGRLRLLVAADLRAKFDAQAAKLNYAEWHGTLDDLLTQCRRMANAWRALDRSATDAGHGPQEAGLWEVELPNGRLLRLARTDADARRAPAGGTVWSLEEVARLIDMQPAAVLALKDTFAGSTVAEVTPVKPTRQPAFVSDEPESIPI